VVGDVAWKNTYTERSERIMKKDLGI